MVLGKMVIIMANEINFTNMTIGERMKYIREHLNLKQQDIADALDTSKSNICHYETGYRNVPETSIKIF